MSIIYIIDSVQLYDTIIYSDIVGIRTRYKCIDGSLRAGYKLKFNLTNYVNKG